MKESYWGYWLLVLGVFIIVVLLLVQSFTSTNTQDYYMVKTITEAAMEDAIDYSYYRNFGEAKINKEKFFESFLRRFAEEASLATTYHISFADVYEAPPKVSVTVSSKAGGFAVVGNKSDIDIVNKIDAILESSEHVVNQGTIEDRNIYYKTFASTRFNLNRELGDTALKRQIDELKGKTISNFNFDADEFSTCPGRADAYIYSCGYPKASAGVEFDMDTIYCIIYSVNDNTCTTAIPLTETQAYFN